MQIKILIVAPAWVGDMVMGQTLLKELKKKHKDVVIDILVNAWAKDVALRMPEVNQVFINPFKHGEFGLVKRIKLGLELRKNKYDQIFVLPNSWKSAIIPFFAGGIKRTGFVGESRYGLLNDIYKLDKQALPKMIDRFCALANHGKAVKDISYPEFRVDIANQTATLKHLGLNKNKPIVCFAPGAEFGPAKRWPTTHFAKLADLLTSKGYQIFVVGSNKEDDLANEIMQLAKENKDIHNLCGKTSLIDVIDIMGCCHSIVSNDSGLMHVAAAVNKAKLIAVYGSSSPIFTPPLSDKADILQIKLDCSPCFKRTCKFGHYDCLTSITPQMVLECIEK